MNQGIMILILVLMRKKKMNHKILFILLCIFIGLPCSVRGQDSQMISVTPPLFQLSVTPGDVWQSEIKVVNGNKYPLTVYTELVNFEATGEVGRGTFSKKDDTQNTLSNWISLLPGPYVIDPEQSLSISFRIEVPKDAPPGGHYAAVLVSTEPPSIEPGVSAVRTSQVVTSLLFARIAGDVVESGTIREFRAVDSFVQEPSTEFSLRFENKGNVHLQPKGNIIISNMWGKERGVIPVNYQTHYGNILPKSIREFSFSWKGNLSLADIGLFRAVVTLGYGENESKNVDAVTYFWVIPIKATIITLLVLAFAVFSIVYMVKLYVRKMLLMAGVNPDREVTSSTPLRREEIIARSYSRVSAPIVDGVLDLRKRLRAPDTDYTVLHIVLSYIKSYKVFFASIAVLICIVVVVVIFFGGATSSHRDYEVRIKEGDTETILNSTVEKP